MRPVHADQGVCCPRFDSPSVFGALLDDERAGHFRIRPARSGYSTQQMYHPDTAVLITRFLTEAGLGEVADFMVPAGREATPRHRLARMVRCVRGEMGRRPHGRTARADRWRTDLGLPLHLGARRLVLRARPAPPRLRRGGSAVRLLAA